MKKYYMYVAYFSQACSLFPVALSQLISNTPATISGSRDNYKLDASYFDFVCTCISWHTFLTKVYPLETSCFIK